MSLYRLARERAAAGNPVRVGLIGAGKFGSMFLNQVPGMPGVEVAVIADLDPERARAACRTVGWDAAQTAKTVFIKSGAEACAHPEVEVVVEATEGPRVLKVRVEPKHQPVPERPRPTQRPGEA